MIVYIVVVKHVCVHVEMIIDTIEGHTFGQHNIVVVACNRTT